MKISENAPYFEIIPSKKVWGAIARSISEFPHEIDSAPMKRFYYHETDFPKKRIDSLGASI